VAPPKKPDVNGNRAPQGQGRGKPSGRSQTPALFAAPRKPR
jgi:hypothetical protein